jgi:hypothetical protein
MASLPRWERRNANPEVIAKREAFNRKQGSPQGARTGNAENPESMNNADADANSAAPERRGNMENDETAANEAPPTSKCENHSLAAQVVHVLQTYVSGFRTVRGRDGEPIQLIALGEDLTGLFYQLPSDMNGDADEDDGSEDDNEEVDDEGDEVADE